MPSISGEGVGVPDGNTRGAGITSLASPRACIGFGADGWLTYASAGAAWAKIDAVILDDLATYPFIAGGSFSVYAAGAGVEKMIFGKFPAGAEVVVDCID